MARDVQATPQFYLGHSQSFSDSVTKTSSRFRATKIWNDIIENFKNQVEVKRRKVMMKTYDQCFTGTNAVDVVLDQLLNDKDRFPNKDITREKAVRLCQIMLDQEVFEVAKGHKSDGKSHTFEDNPNKLYRFSADKENATTNTKCQKFCKPDDCLSSEYSMAPDSAKSSSSVSSLLHGQQGVVQELLELTGTWCRRNSDVAKRKLTPSRLFLVGTGAKPSTKSRVSLPASGMQADFNASSDLDGLEKLTPEVEDELMREHALSQLLTLLDIPILDSILSYEAVMAKPSGKRKAYSNPAFKRSDSILSVYSIRSEKEDPWWTAAMDCLDCIPRSGDILDTSLQEHTDLTQKLRLYQSIANYYTSLDKPLWSENFVDIHVGLLNLLMQGRNDQVFKGLCLSIILLPTDVCEELRRLLKFLYHATEDDAVPLSSTDNRSLIEHTFTPAIIRNKMLTPHQAGQLVMFMVTQANRLWQAPDEVEKAVRKSLLEIQEGKEKQVSSKVYCSQVSQEEFRRQQEQLTEQSLVDLMNMILDSTKMSVKDKKQKLKHLQKHHPKIYWKHFSDIM